MPRVTKGVLWSEVDGQKVALSQTYGADGEPQLVSEATPMPVKGTMQLSGSIVDQRGLAVNKPDPTTVEIGTTYWSVDTDPLAAEVEVSDGTKWVVMA